MTNIGHRASRHSALPPRVPARTPVNRKKRKSRPRRQIISQLRRFDVGVVLGKEHRVIWCEGFGGFLGRGRFAGEGRGEGRGEGFGESLLFVNTPRVQAGS